MTATHDPRHGSGSKTETTDLDFHTPDFKVWARTASVFFEVGGRFTEAGFWGHLFAEHLDSESDEPTDIIGVIKWGSNPAVWVRGVAQGWSPPLPPT